MRVKIIIAGTRTFNDYQLLEETMDSLLKSFDKDDQIILVSGHAKGADYLGEKYAYIHNYKCKLFPAKWNKYGKAAGMIGNKEMLKFITSQGSIPFVVVFWDGESKGTKNMIEISQERNVPIKIIEY